MLSPSVSSRCARGSQVAQKKRGCMLIVAIRNRLHINLERREGGGGGSEDGCMSFFVAVLSALIIPALPDLPRNKTRT